MLQKRERTLFELEKKRGSMCENDEASIRINEEKGKLGVSPGKTR